MGHGRFIRIDLVLIPSTLRSTAVVWMSADVTFILGEHRPNTALEFELCQRTIVAPIDASVVHPTVVRIRMISFLRTHESIVSSSFLRMEDMIRVIFSRR